MTTASVGQTRESVLRNCIRAFVREWRHMAARISPAARREQSVWEQHRGPAFLRGLGLRSGDAMVDFGCGAGAYALPAACVAGERGLVVAVDARARERKRVRRLAAARGADCLRVAGGLAEARALLGVRRCRLALLYDVLHFMDGAERRRLYREVRTLMAEDGVLSVHPKHVRDDQPARFFRDVTVEDVIREVVACGFLLTNREVADLWHDHGRIRGVMLMFGLKDDAGEKGPTENKQQEHKA